MKDLGIPFTAVHFNHNLRPESNDETIWLEKLFSEWGVPFVTDTWQDKPTKSGRVQSEAREARYSFFIDVCQKHEIKNLLLAHTRDDVAETFLMRLFYGSGSRGLRSIAGHKVLSEGVELHRPLLSIDREDLRSYLFDKNQDWLEDSSNYQAKYVRIRARYWLKNIGLTDEFIKLAHNFAELEQSIGSTLEAYQKDIEHGDTITKCSTDILKLPDFIRLRLFKDILTKLNGQSYMPRTKQFIGLFDYLEADTRPRTLGKVLWWRDDHKILAKLIDKE